jgi:hypothetical protein
MAIYTVVDDSYDVDVFKTFKALCDRYYGSDWFLDDDRERPCTNSSLRAELRKFGEARIYDSEGGDWRYKAVIHK